MRAWWCAGGVCFTRSSTRARARATAIVPVRHERPQTSVLVSRPSPQDMIERQSKRAELWNDEADALDAFAACGGGQDGSGTVSRTKLVDILHSLGIFNFPIDRMIDMVDLDRSGLIVRRCSPRPCLRKCARAGDGGPTTVRDASAPGVRMRSSRALALRAHGHAVTTCALRAP